MLFAGIVTNQEFIRYAKSMEGAEYTTQGILNYIYAESTNRDWFNKNFGRKDLDDWLAQITKYSDSNNKRII